MDQDRRKVMIDALNKKGANRPCPRCGHLQFSLVEETVVSLQPDPSAFVTGGPIIPVVVTACNNCGLVCQHALGVLGVTPMVGAENAG